MTGSMEHSARRGSFRAAPCSLACASARSHRSSLIVAVSAIVRASPALRSRLRSTSPTSTGLLSSDARWRRPDTRSSGERARTSRRCSNLCSPLRPGCSAIRHAVYARDQARGSAGDVPCRDPCLPSCAPTRPGRSSACFVPSSPSPCRRCSIPRGSLPSHTHTHSFSAPSPQDPWHSAEEDVGAESRSCSSPAPRHLPALSSSRSRSVSPLATLVVGLRRRALLARVAPASTRPRNPRAPNLRDAFTGPERSSASTATSTRSTSTPPGSPAASGRTVSSSSSPQDGLSSPAPCSGSGWRSPASLSDLSSASALCRSLLAAPS